MMICQVKQKKCQHFLLYLGIPHSEEPAQTWILAAIGDQGLIKKRKPWEVNGIDFSQELTLTQ